MDRCERIAQVRAFHERWGKLDVDDADLLELWEELGRILDADDPEDRIGWHVDQARKGRES